MKIKENFALSGWGNFKTKDCKVIIFDSSEELHYLNGKKILSQEVKVNLTTTNPFQSKKLFPRLI